MIEHRLGRQGLGFGATINSKEKRNLGELLTRVRGEDLLKYGLIPEFIGRLPVTATLTELDEAALVRVLTEPKNALVKQYKKLFDIDHVQLTFTDGALRAVAELAVKRKTGARGLRAILEQAMLDIMYDIPSQSNIHEVIISEEVIAHKEKPFVVYHEEKEAS